MGRGWVVELGWVVVTGWVVGQGWEAVWGWVVELDWAVVWRSEVPMVAEVWVVRAMAGARETETDRVTMAAVVSSRHC